MQDSHPVGARRSSNNATVRAPWRERASWALYDFANTIFSMNVATLYFSVWFIKDLGASSVLYAMGSGVTVVAMFAASLLLLRHVPAPARVRR